MADKIQRRRGTTAEHSTFTGAIGEVTVDTDKNTLVVHDNSKAGGYPAARESTVEGRLVIDFATDADYTLTAEQARNAVLVFTDTGTVLTTGRNVILPTDTRILIVENDSAQTLTFKTSAGTGKAVTAGRTAFVRGDGTNVVSAFDEIDILYANTGVYLGGSAAANLLDDYEEGSWSPVLWDGSQSSGEGQTYGANTFGRYTKIGNKVILHGRIQTTGLGTLTTSDNALIGGLPFVGTGGEYGTLSVGHATGLNLSTAAAVSGYQSASGTFCILRKFDSTAGTSGILISNFTTSSDLIFSIVYNTQS